MTSEAKTIRKEVAEDLINHLDGYKGATVYGCDLAFTLFEGYNVDGSVTYSRYKAQEWIKAHFDELGEIVEDMRDNWEYEAGADIFDNPEKFMTSCYLWVASEICGQLDSVNEIWDDETELTADLIDKITKELETID